MPAILKQELKERLLENLKKRGIESLFEKIADENNGGTIEELASFLMSVDHPAISMKPLF
jgi:acetyl-CoA synthase